MQTVSHFWYIKPLCASADTLKEIAYAYRCTVRGHKKIWICDKLRIKMGWSGDPCLQNLLHFYHTRKYSLLSAVMQQQSDYNHWGSQSKKIVFAFLPNNYFLFFHSLSLKQTVNNTTCSDTLSPEVTLSSCPFFVTAWQERISTNSFSSTPSFPHQLHLRFYAYVLFIHSSQIGSWELRDICCTYFEDASCCSITYRAKVSFACSGIESASLTGGGREHARQAVW